VNRQYHAEAGWCWPDALALADEEKPDLLIDMGTLTGRHGWGWARFTALLHQR